MYKSKYTQKWLITYWLWGTWYRSQQWINCRSIVGKKYLKEKTDTTAFNFLLKDNESKDRTKDIKFYEFRTLT